MRRAFTLIELLIVIAIIAILALIAVPNFLEGSVRAKVSRVTADMRSRAVALEACAIADSSELICERFGTTAPIYFTVWGPDPPASTRLTVDATSLGIDIGAATVEELIEGVAIDAKCDGDVLILTVALRKNFTRVIRIR